MKRLRLSLFSTLLMTLSLLPASAQEWLQAHVLYDGYTWTFPFPLLHVEQMDMTDGRRTLQIHTADESDIVVPFSRPEYAAEWQMGIDSLTVADSLAEDAKGKNKYKVFAIHVTTQDGVAIKSKETYIPCYISVDGRGQYQRFAASGRIRGRGNSTWSWYDKKPYRIKFDKSHKLLGIDKDKDWVLLANWRDVTKVMNTYCSLAADYMGIPYTTPIRFAELFINGKYNGLYQVAEQVEVGKNRVPIDEEGGLLLTIDADDGPNHSPDSGDNFWSAVYQLPIAVKSPKPLTQEQLDSIKADFAQLESAIKAGSYHVTDSLMDIPSYIAMLQLQEFVYNVELEAPRSLFLFKDKGGKYTFGPAWDWDAGFDFSWSDMYTGHTYFRNYQTSLLGYDPYRRRGARNNSLNHFFSDLFQNRRFVQQYKDQWASYADSIVIKPWKETVKYIQGMVEGQYKTNGTNTSPQLREDARWPISGFKPTSERSKMLTWLQNRLSYINTMVGRIPLPDDDDDPDVPDVPSDYTLKGTIALNYTLQQRNGYSQNVQVEVSRDKVAELLGLTSSELNDADLNLLPLNADGTEGNNTAAGTYGAWFDDDGNTTSFQTGFPYVYLESDDLYTWACGCHPQNSQSADPCTVTMQFQHLKTAGAVNVKVTFEIKSGGGWWW